MMVIIEMLSFVIVLRVCIMEFVDVVLRLDVGLFRNIVIGVVVSFILMLICFC